MGLLLLLPAPHSAASAAGGGPPPPRRRPPPGRRQASPPSVSSIENRNPGWKERERERESQQARGSCPEIFGRRTQLTRFGVFNASHLVFLPSIMIFGCQESKGHDWHKIAHFPDLRIEQDSASQCSYTWVKGPFDL
ncbi:hypothetical protein DAI22_04g100200 [Oryza sativa Japonica Group]|nr:hypothetical protein DAI22_04g100200 [Oryza sativa Japonica Group]